MILSNHSPFGEKVLTNLSTFNETHQPAEALGCLFNGLVPSRSGNDDFEAWIATLTQLAEEHEQEVRITRNVRTDISSREVRPPLPKLAAGPWRSLGGYFDYSHWPDRERFLELDKAIATNRERDMEII